MSPLLPAWHTAANAERVPVLGETQTALVTSEFTGASWYHSVQATLRKQSSKGLTFQAAYTFSKAESNLTVLNDQNDLTLNKARAAFDRTHPAGRELRLPTATAGRRRVARTRADAG
jgi:hypothetical protein